MTTDQHDPVVSKPPDEFLQQLSNLIKAVASLLSCFSMLLTESSSPLFEIDLLLSLAIQAIFAVDAPVSIISDLEVLTIRCVEMLRRAR